MRTKVKAHKIFTIPLLDGEHVVAIVAKTPAQMKEIDRIISGKCKGARTNKKFFARCFQWKKRRGEKEVAVVLFCKKWIGSGIVAHEMYHATTHYARWRRLSEESCALIMEILVKSFWKGWYSKRFKNEFVVVTE